MNKRLYLILFPILALIVSINCRGDNTVFSNKPFSNATIITAAQNHLPYSVNLNKQSDHKAKNAIRIKACEGSAAIVFIAGWLPVSIKSYHTKPIYFYNNNHTLSFHSCQHKLRGPPVA